MLSRANAELGGTLWEALMYGAYIAILPQGIRILLRNDFRGRILNYFIFTLVISFLAITVHLSANFARVIEAFTSHSDVPNYPDHFYSINNDRLNVLKMSGYVITTLIMDVLIVFRTYMIWNRDWRIILFPVVLCCADTGKSVWIVIATGLTATPPSTGFFAPSLQLLAFFALTLGLNFICTSLIVFKIFRARHLLNKFIITRQRRLNGALALVIESAAIYSMFLFLALILAVARSNALYIIFNMLPPMIGIVFLYVILRSAEQKRNTTVLQSTVLNSNTTQTHDPVQTEIHLDSPPHSAYMSTSPHSVKPRGLHGYAQSIISFDSSDHRNVSDKGSPIGQEN
ncbi:unnamed protein product [Somion occarium]